MGSDGAQVQRIFNPAELPRETTAASSTKTTDRQIADMNERHIEERHVFLPSMQGAREKLQRAKGLREEMYSLFDEASGISASQRGEIGWDEKKCVKKLEGMGYENATQLFQSCQLSTFEERAARVEERVRMYSDAAQAITNVQLREHLAKAANLEAGTLLAEFEPLILYRASHVQRSGEGGEHVEQYQADFLQLRDANSYIAYSMMNKLYNAQVGNGESAMYAIKPSKKLNEAYAQMANVSGTETAAEYHGDIKYFYKTYRAVSERQITSLVRGSEIGSATQAMDKAYVAAAPYMEALTPLLACVSLADPATAAFGMMYFGQGAKDDIKEGRYLDASLSVALLAVPFFKTAIVSGESLVAAGRTVGRAVAGAGKVGAVVGHAAGGYFMLNMAGQGIGVALDIAKYGLNEQDVQALAGLGMLTFVGFGENVPEARFNIGQNYDRRLGGLDKSISGSHGELTWANGRIQYKDTSLFGTAILKGNELVKLDRGKTIDLQEGDEIYIGGIRKEGANNKYEIANNARARYVVEGNLLHLEMREDLAKWDSWTRQDGPIGHIDVAGQVETRLQARDGQALGRTGLEERFGQNAARAGLPVSEREMKEHLKKQFPEGEQNGNGGSARETTKGFVQVDNTRNRGDFGPKVHIAVPSLGNASYAAISAKVADMLGQMNRELEAQGIIPPTFKIGNNRENFSGDQTGKNITVYFSDVKAYGRALPHLHRISEYLTEAAESLGFKGGERECIEFRVAEQRNEGKAVGKLNRDAEWEVAEFITMGVRQHDATRPLIISRRDVEEFKSMLPDHGERAQIDRILADRRLNPEAGMEFVGMLNDKERASVLDAARKDDPALKGGYLLFSDEFLRNNSTSLMNRMMSYLYMEGKVSAMASF